MSSIHHRKLKLIELDIDGNTLQCQVQTWRMVNNTEDGEKIYAYCPDGEDREEADPDYALELVLYADWRSAGASHYLTVHDGETATFQLDHYPDIPAEHVRWTGSLKIKAPTAGGEIRTTEMTEVTLPVLGKPTYLHL